MARQPKYKQQPKYLVICEDSKSSKDYLEDAAHEYRVNIYFKIVHIGFTDPLNIVTRAIKSSNDYEKIFCVIDRDNHQNFDAAIQLFTNENKANVEMIVSYPCYEYWFCLHVGYVRKSYRPTNAKSSAKQLIDDLINSDELFSDYEKGGTKGLFSLIYEKHKPKYDQAHKNAALILKEVDKDGEINPSTRIHLLLNHIEDLTKPKLVVQAIT